MRYPFITAAATFFLGLSIGSLALERQVNPASGEETGYPKTGGDASAGATVVDISKAPGPKAAGSGTESPAMDFPQVVDGLSGIELGPVDDADKIRILAARWANQERLLGQLENRLLSLEQQLTNLKTERMREEDEQAVTEEALPVATPEDRRVALMAAGVTQTTAEEIVTQQSRLELERLELQDQALREGWYQTNRYFETLGELNEDAVELRAEIGDQAYDEYRYQTGMSNRVKVTSVIQGSAAEQSGLLPGDIIESYDEERIYDYAGLRGATADGARGETVPILIRRGDYLIESEVPRGPLGVRLESLTASPSS